ncbi:MAG: GNAT family N-acetyltransferase [Elusimicrobia bacterium]|nr:GNAT family N-acetyltransferase [Elusimicrobiota bacterium]
MTGPLAGRKVLLRPLEEADAPALFEAVEASRAGLRRRFGWVESARTVEDEVAFVRARSADRQEGGALTFGIFDARGKRLLGVAALDPIVRATSRGQLGLWVRADEQDKGYGVEAGRLAVEHAFRKLALRRLSSRIDPVNRGARKVLQRLGFRYEGCLRQDKRLNHRWVDQECWGILRSEWKPAAGARGRR